MDYMQASKSNPDSMVLIDIRNAPAAIKKEKTLYWLYVYDGYFNVAVWFKEKNRTDALKADISEKTKQIIRKAKNEMGLPTFPVVFKITTTDALTDIYSLIDCKKKSRMLNYKLRECKKFCVNGLTMTVEAI